MHINRATMKLTIVNAGHPPVVCLPAKGDAFLIKLDGDVLPTMLKIITVDQSRRFIKKIFRKDGKKYIRFIRLIDRIPYWKAAYSTTIKLFRKLRVSRYSKEALELSNLIYLHGMR